MTSTNQTQIETETTAPIKQITATVYFQFCINDRILDSDKVLDFDVTPLILQMSHDDIANLLDNDDSSDSLAIDAGALIGHDNPYRVEVVDSILEYFEVDDLEDITLDLVTEARARDLMADHSSLFRHIRACASLLQVGESSIPESERSAIPPAIDRGVIRGLYSLYGIHVSANMSQLDIYPALSGVCAEAAKRGYDWVEIIPDTTTH